MSQSGPYAIVGIGKVKASALALCHAARAEDPTPPPHSFPDNPRPEVLFNAAPPGVTFPEFVAVEFERAKAEGRVYQGGRRDQVLAVEGLLTASPEFFRPKNPKAAGKYDPERVAIFRERALKFLQDQFGDQLVRAELQLDETTPHVQFAMLPVNANGSWSAKKYVTPEKIRALWDDWATATADLGLKRGLRNSEAKHEKVRTFYASVNHGAALNDAADKALVVTAPKIKPPSRLELLDPQKYADSVNEDLKNWAALETKKMKKATKTVTADAASAEIARRRSRDDRLTSEKLSAAYDALAAEHADLKATVGKYREIPVATVAARCDFFGEIDKKAHRNSIDFLKATQGLDYQQAVAWLHLEFGAENAAAAAALHTHDAVSRRTKSPPRPDLPAEKVIKTEVKRQLDALDAEKYRLSIVPAREGAKPFNLGKRGDEPERFFTADEVVEKVPFLRVKNKDHHVYVTPISEENHYILVDDTKSPTALESERFTPCMTVESSPGKYQSVLRVPAKTTVWERVNEFFKSINERIGDPKITGLRHPFRLAGFRNVKPKYESQAEPGIYPFVKLTRAISTSCRRAVELITGSNPKATFTDLEKSLLIDKPAPAPAPARAPEPEPIEAQLAKPS